MKGEGHRAGVSKVVRTLRGRYLGSRGHWKPYKLPSKFLALLRLF